MSNPLCSEKKKLRAVPKELAGAGTLQGDSRGPRGKRRQPSLRVSGAQPHRRRGAPLGKFSLEVRRVVIGRGKNKSSFPTGAAEGWGRWQEEI